MRTEYMEDRQHLLLSHFPQNANANMREAISLESVLSRIKSLGKFGGIPNLDK